MIHNPFNEDYDILFEDLKNTYLIQASLKEFLNEAPMVINSGNTGKMDAAWYIKWKNDFVNILNNSFHQFQEYANRQNQKYGRWLRDNSDYFKSEDYGAGVGTSLPNAPDYRSAIARIRQPIPTSLNGPALNRLQVSDSKTPSSSGDNRFFYKILIPEYDGTGDDFLNFCRGYYNGNDKKQTISIRRISMFIPIFYNYCLNFPQMVNVLAQQMQQIITFVNQDPMTGQYNPSDNAQKQYNQLQQNQNNGIASTNPNNNIVQHASVDFTQYILEAETISGQNTVGNVGTGSIAKNVNVVNNNQRGNNGTPQKNTTNQNNNIQNSKVNAQQLSRKRRQYAANIIKDAFLAKVSAAGNIYRDCITVLQVHIKDIQDKIQKKNQKIAEKNAREVDKANQKLNKQQ